MSPTKGSLSATSALHISSICEIHNPLKKRLRRRSSSHIEEDVCECMRQRAVNMHLMEFSWAIICSSVGLELASGAGRASGGVEVTISAVFCSPELSPGATETLFTEVWRVFSARLTLADGMLTCPSGLLSASSVKLSCSWWCEVVPTEDAAFAGLCPPCEADATIVPYSCLQSVVKSISATCLLRQETDGDWAVLGNGQLA